MESTTLTSFYESVTSWPRNDAELGAAAEALVGLMGARFACIQALDGDKPICKLVVRRADGSLGADGPAFEDLLRKQVQSLEGKSTAPARVRQFQLASEAALPAGVPASRLAIVPLVADAVPEGAPRLGRARRNLGWIAVGSAKVLSPREEILLIAAAERLSSLGEISQLQASLQLRSQFLSIASHELKTPLTSIYGVLQLQERMLRLKKDESSEQQRERHQSYLKMVIRQVQRLNELIDGLLDVSRIQNGRFAIEPAETDVASLLREAASARLAVIAQEAGVKLALECPERLVAWVDPMRMEEVINNLVMNAIRFSPEGGTVRIRLAEESGSMRLTVRDQGPAVQPGDRERIFQPFERTARTSRLGGLGLGLFISRQIAQLHGGNVSLVESVPGKGNLLEAYFPVKALNLVSA